MPVFAYADETIFSLDEKDEKKALGCGVLICSEQIPDQVVFDALNNLRQDPEVNKKKDLKTLDRKYFHGSEDSKNAHSHFCNAIRKHVKGVFDFSYFTNTSPEHFNNQSHFSGIINRCLSSSSIEFFNYPNEVVLVIEKRAGLDNNAIQKWKNYIYHNLEGASYDIPSYKTFFPQINIELSGKANPGLQVVDFCYGR